MFKTETTTAIYEVDKILIDSKTRFSIIVPVYQEEKILEKTLSIFSKEILKKYNAELIISDGGSTDRTVEISKKFTTKVVIHRENRRQTIAEGRNLGASIANGEILIFINCDTVPNNIHKFFECISTWAAKEKNYGALAFAVRCFPDEEKLKDKIFYFLHNKYVKLLNKIGIGMGRGECQVVRKDIFDKVGGYNPKISAGEDFDLYRRIAKVSKIKFVDDIFVYESPRRFRRYGYIKTLLIWLLNAIYVIFLGKSFSNDWEPIR